MESIRDADNWQEDSERELERRASLAFTLPVLMTLSLGWLFKDYFYALSHLMLDKDYGYIGVAVVTVFTTLYFSLKQVGFAYGVSLQRLLIGAYLVAISLIFYASSIIDPRYMVQYLGLSFSFLLLAFTLVILTPVYARDLLSLASILLLVPPPPGWVDALTPHLSRVVGELAGAITGSRILRGPGYTTLVVDTHSGPVRFQVEYACTGIVTMSSVLVVMPIILYLLAYSPKPLKRKALASILALLVSIAIGFTGNLVRVLLVIYGAKWLGPEEGLTLFHYSPSIIYATLSVLAGFYIADRLGGIRLALPRLNIGRVLSKPEAILGALVIIIVLIGFFLAGVNAITYMSSGRGLGPKAGLVLEAGSPLDYINNPSKYIRNINNVSIIILGKDEVLTRLLNAFVVYKIIVKYNNNSYLGYMEIVDTPGRLHTWQLCLTLQGYKVENSYTRNVNGTPIYFITMNRKGHGYLLAYTLIPTKIISPESSYELYTRISLIAHYSNKTRKSVETSLAYTLSRVWSSTEAATLWSLSRFVYYTSLASYLLLILIVAHWVYGERHTGVEGLGVRRG